MNSAIRDFATAFVPLDAVPCAISSNDSEPATLSEFIRPLITLLPTAEYSALISGLAYPAALEAAFAVTPFDATFEIFFFAVVQPPENILPN